MKIAFSFALCLVTAGLLLSACSQTPGSVIRENVAEMLQSPRMAVTASLPGWMLEKRSISALAPAEIEELRTLLLPGQVRSVPEKYYRDPSEGNRGDTSDNTFYIYASNAQCLGGRLVEGKVQMDDFSLSEAQQTRLKSLLMPHLRKIGIAKESAE